MRAPDSAIEVRRDSRAGQRVLEDADVVLRRADQDRDFVETNAICSFFENASRDFDAFPAFARRGKPDELAGALTFGRRLCGKQVARKSREIRIAFGLASLQLDAAFLELRDRAHVAVGNGNKRLR